jgi:hypothetical protein
MTPVEITAEIKKLYGSLLDTLADDDSDWDGDYAALLSVLADAEKATERAIDRVWDNVARLEGEEWGPVLDELADGLTHLTDTTGVIRTAGEHAKRAQDADA